MTTKIRVTQRHIDSGVSGGSTSCPVALAVREVLGVDADVSVGSYTLGYRPKNRLDYRLLDLPTRVTDFISRFDKGLEVDPFEFELPGPEIHEA